MKAKTPDEYEIWTADDCAQYLGVTRGVFFKTIKTNIDFPRQLQYSIGCHPRWLAEDIKRWTVKLAVDTDRPAFVYRAYDDSQRLLYVGVSSRPEYRKSAHKMNSAWFPYATAFTYMKFDKRSDALKAEKQAIIDEMPHYNKAHNRRANDHSSL